MPAQLPPALPGLPHGVYENSGIAVRIPPERVYEISRNPHVGKEPLVALFAAQGCHVLASDLQPEKAEVSGWKQSGAEYADGLAGLNDAGLCDSESFARLVMYMDIDMTDIPTDLGDFDFSWSSCAFEHLGSLDAGCSFVMDQMKLLRPGGVGVHTTELNVSSNDNTIDSGGTVLFRRRDIEELGSRLRAEGYDITLDLSEGDTPEDQHVDVPPFSDTHLRTTLGEFVTTSVGLIIEKPVDWTPPRLGLASRIRNRIGSL